MTGSMVVQGREVSDADIELIRYLLAEHPTRGRTRLSEELCRRWNWRNEAGRLKAMACRTLPIYEAPSWLRDVRWIFWFASFIHNVSTSE